MSVLIFTIICFSIFMLIVFAIYYFIYKNRINKKLQNHESTAHVSMASSESVGKILLTVIVIVFSVSGFCMIAKISSNIDSLNDYLYDEIFLLRRELYELKDQLQEQISEQNSHFLTFECELGEVDNVNHTVEAFFRCIPKTSGNDTSISVTIEENATIEKNSTIEENTIILEKNSNGMYTGKMDLPLFNYINKIYASITTNGITTSSTVHADFSSRPHVDCLPQLVGYLDDDFKYKNNKFYINGTYYADIFEENNDTTISETQIGIKDAKLIFKINGKIEKEIAITKYSTNISENFPAKTGDKIEIIVNGTDNYGYIHQRLLLATEKNDSWSESYSDSIFDSNGKLLYSEEGIYKEITGENSINTILPTP